MNRTELYTCILPVTNDQLKILIFKPDGFSSISKGNPSTKLLLLYSG